MPDEHLTDEQIDELGTLLVAVRPHPREAFAAQLDARVAARFAQPSAPAADVAWWRTLLQRPLLPAAATGLAVAVVAVMIAFGGGGRGGSGTMPDGGKLATPTFGALQRDGASGQTASGGSVAADSAGSQAERAPAPSAAKSLSRSGARKVEQSASLSLGTPSDRLDDVAQAVLATTDRFDGIVDQSSVANGQDGGSAQFALRIPAGRLEAALAALSRLPDALVLARSDDSVDVNQAYVSIRRRLANARAERAGVLHALQRADSDDELLRLHDRLDVLEATIAQGERAQRGLDRRVDYARVSVDLQADDGSGGSGAGDGTFTVGRAFHDALRVLEVAAGVVVIAAAALLPLALVLACAWPLALLLRRRRREQALDAAA